MQTARRVVQIGNQDCTPQTLFGSSHVRGLIRPDGAQIPATPNSIDRCPSRWYAYAPRKGALDGEWEQSSAIVQHTAWALRLGGAMLSIIVRLNPG